jgi:hypothetical protein
MHLILDFLFFRDFCGTREFFYFQELIAHNRVEVFALFITT